MTWRPTRPRHRATSGGPRRTHGLAGMTRGMGRGSASASASDGRTTGGRLSGRGAGIASSAAKAATERVNGPLRFFCGSGALELGQLAAVTLQEFLVNVAVSIIPNLTDPIVPKPEDAAGSLVHHVLRVGLQPRALADLHDHPLLRLVPIAPDVLVSPVGGAQAGLAVPEGIEHRLAAAPFAADPGSASHPIDDVIGEVAPCFRSVPGEQRLLVRLGYVHTTAHTVISSISSGSGSVLAFRPARSIGLASSALCRSMKGKGGNTKPSSAQKVNMAPATA